MKRLLCCLALLLCLLTASACAEAILDSDYTDVPSMMTQDSVVDMEVAEGCSITLLQPDEKSMALLEDVYTFVWEEKNRPVRYYDEETQRKIQALIPGTDIDALHMTEFMAQQMQGEPQDTVKVQRLLDVDYQPGQLVIVVLGIEEENGAYRWFPYKGEVPATGLISYEIPVEDYACLNGQKVIYHVLTTRVGPRGDVLTYYEILPERYTAPSKDAGDIIRVRRWYAKNGNAMDDSFSIFLVDKTKLMEEEIQRIGQHLAEEKPAMTWFSEALQQEAQLLLPEGVDMKSLVIYDAVAVKSRDYKDTYGDVACEHTFASAYDPERSVVAMLGFPIQDAQEAPYFTWYCQRADAIEDYVQIDYKQLLIPRMETEPAMLIVLSQPIGE